MFLEHIISLCSELPGLTRLPDLSACGYLLEEYFKAEVYITRPWATDDLKITIHKQILLLLQHPILKMMPRSLENMLVFVSRNCSTEAQLVRAY